MFRKKKVLVIEDDQDLSKLLGIYLTELNIEVEASANGQEGLLKALNEDFDLIVLDIMLPGMDGLEVCRKIRREQLDVPVIILTSKAEEIDKVLGLETGADDYMTKPFSPREFQARIKAILRRTSPIEQTLASPKIIEKNGLLIDLTKRRVHLNNEAVMLTPKEFELLYFMASNPGKIYSRVDLLREVWHYDFEGYEHTVNSHINRLRTKLEKDMAQPEFILTVWGFGYTFNEN